MLDRIHPADGNPLQCCFHGPDFNMDKDMRSVLHQYNLKHQKDTRQNENNQDRSKFLPRPANLVPPKTNLLHNVVDKSHLTTDDHQDYYFNDNFSCVSETSDTVVQYENIE